MEFGIWIHPTVTVYETPEYTIKTDAGQLHTNAADEGLYGFVCRILEQKDGWCHVLASYGYSSWCQEADLLPVTWEQAQAWLSDCVVMTGRATDVLTAPTVHGARLMTLSAGSLVRQRGAAAEGWLPVLLADGREGFVPEKYTDVKRFGETALCEDPCIFLDAQQNAIVRRANAQGGQNGFSFQKLLEIWFHGSEEAFRKALVDTAQSYLGTQYRWGGRSSFGIDCSGLVGISYLRNGVTVYRDASIVDGYPLKRLDLRFPEGVLDGTHLADGSILPGDALYFPGHVGMYLGDGEYIHSTGKAGSNGVVINSLRPGDANFREDLLKSMYAAAGLRLGV